MKPVVALIGRPNVGKSTIFNQLTHSRQALVADLAGLTRDRQYGDATFEEKSFIVIDTAPTRATSDLWIKSSLTRSLQARSSTGRAKADPKLLRVLSPGISATRRGGDAETFRCG